MELSPDEKIGILLSHQKNLAFNKYNFQVNLVEEKAKDAPSNTVINDYEIQIAQLDKQIAALQEEFDLLKSESAKTY